ncbi:MAG: sodium/glutamate symporter [Alistipes sp.]|nr:sodium/glutamate symporter [Candidatus Alistipes equi]
MQLDMFLAAAVGILATLFGSFINRRLSWLSKICIPDPVIGGIFIALITLFTYKVWDCEISFDGTIKDICMMIFFTTVGFQSDMSMLKRGGKKLVTMVVIVSILIFCQDIIGVVLAKAMGQSSILGLAAGSITMAGGHGTAAGFSSVLGQMGLSGADAILMAAATFGLVGGSLIGGPLSERTIRKLKLDSALTDEQEKEYKEVWHKDETKEHILIKDLLRATYEIFLAMALGLLISKLIEKTGLTVPSYFGSLIAAVIIRNVTEQVKIVPKLKMNGILAIGDISLILFLGMAMVSLKLWQLESIALPLLAILCAQVSFIALYARHIAFPLLGKNYDAALLMAGLCGFGLGATPNAIANMSAVSTKYRYSALPFIIIPIVGAMFVDIINIAVITLFMNFF